MQIPFSKTNTIYDELLKQFPEITRSQVVMKNIKHGVIHAIITKGQPVTAKAHRLAPDKLKAMKLEFEFMLQQGLCRPSKSSWASPLHLVPIKTRNWKCGNFRKLNAITESDRYPIPTSSGLCIVFTRNDYIFNNRSRPRLSTNSSQGRRRSQNGDNNALRAMSSHS